MEIRPYTPYQVWEIYFMKLHINVSEQDAKDYWDGNVIDESEKGWVRHDRWRELMDIMIKYLAHGFIDALNSSSNDTLNKLAKELKAWK